MPVIQECLPAKHVLICLPTYDGTNAVETTAGLIGGCIGLLQAEIKFSFAYTKGTYIDNSRNWLATKFMKSQATDLIFIDSDVGFSYEAMVRVAKARRPFIGGVYPKKNDERKWPVKFKEDKVEADPDGFLSPDLLPTGFLRLNRAVFETMDHEDYYDQDDDLILGYFKAGPKDRQWGGEDGDFCARWLALGGQIHLIPDLTFTHTGNKTWSGNFAIEHASIYGSHSIRAEPE
jgi:hypothetical protein